MQTTNNKQQTTNNKQQTTTRVWQFELLRCLACLSVVFLHSLGEFATVQSYKFFGAVITSISSFGVPIFVMISGYFLLSNPHNMDCNYFYKKRLKRIGIPLLFWSCFYLIWAIFILFKKGEDASLIWNIVFDLLYKGAPQDAGHLWYLYMITGLYMVTPFLLTVCLKYSMKITLFNMVFLYLVYCFQWNYNMFRGSNYSPCILLSFIGYLPYFFFGKYWGENIQTAVFSQKKYRIILISIFFIASVPEALLCRNYDLHWILGKFFPLITLQVIAIYLFVLSIKITPSKLVLKILTWISSLSFGIYLIHYFLVSVINYLFCHILGYESTVFSGILKAIFSFAISVCLTVIFKKTPYLRKCV